MEEQNQNEIRDTRTNHVTAEVSFEVEETILDDETMPDGNVGKDHGTSSQMDFPGEEDVITDALIANDEGEENPSAAAEEASEEEEAENLERKDSEEQLSGLDDGADEEDLIPSGNLSAAEGESDQPIDPDSLVEVVGVRFRTAGKAYYFAVGKLPVKRGSHIIVETARGLEYGTSVCDPMKIDKKRFKAPVKRIVRLATPSDDKRIQENRVREREAYHVCFEKIREHNLDMKLIDAEYTFDRNKILFYFTSDGRVDFRDLVKDLAGVFHTRIELRQIGVRDETKILGGYGICGRPLCCHTYLSDFVPVSIKMAKEQNLSLNPTKISGLCGRLMCCLKNEEDTYEELNKNLPRLGDEVQGNDGLSGEVASVNILKQTVRILVEVDDEKELHEYPADQITILRRRKRGQAKPRINRAELKSPASGTRSGFKNNRHTESGEPATVGPAVSMQETDNRSGEIPEPVQERRTETETGRPMGTGDSSARDRGHDGFDRNDRDRRGRGNRDFRRPDSVRQEQNQPEGDPAKSGGPGGRRPYRKRYNNRRGNNDRRREGQPSETKREN